MNKEAFNAAVDFFSLALQGILRKKQSTILVFLVLLFSFSCAVTTLSLTGSIRDTNLEYRMNTFGEWYIAATNTTEEYGTWLNERDWAQDVAHARVYGQVSPSNHVSHPSGNFGTVDQAYLDMGRAELISGRLPNAEGEIAVEARILRALGIETYTLGQEIDLTALISAQSTVAGEEKNKVVHDKLSGTLCGVFNNFTTLWSIGDAVVHVMITEETAQALFQHSETLARDRYPNYCLLGPADQYFIRVNQGSRLQARREAQEHTFYSQNGDFQQADFNYGAYPSGQEDFSNEDFYAYLVAAVALIAVLCIYIMQLPAQVHSFAILRSIGITMRQLLSLTLIESMLLAIPAIALGIPLGAFLTYASLQLLMYSGSVPVQITIPYPMLGKLFLLWMGIILLSKLVIFFVSIRTPLTGQMQMRAGTSRQTKRLRSALIMVIMIIFDVAAAYTATVGCQPIYWSSWYKLVPDYVINAMSEPISLDTAQEISQIPGISQVEGFGTGNSGENSPVLSLSYEGLDERRVSYYILDENYWDAAIDFGEDKEAFHNGEIVVLCFGGPSQAAYETLYGPVEEILPAAGAQITLRAYNRTGDYVLAEDRVNVQVKHLADNAMGRRYAVFKPYTVVFSQEYLKKFLSHLAPGAQWGVYTGGEAFGYDKILATVDLNAKDLSTDLALETFSRNNGLYLVNNREELQTKRQIFLQELIMLFTCCGCAALVALLLFIGVLALEAEGEKRSFGILQTIGMSKNQVRNRVCGKSLVRSIFAAAVGWILTWCFSISKKLQAGSTLSEAFRDYFDQLFYFGLDLEATLLIFIICVLILMSVSYLVKHRLWKCNRTQQS